ncbi:hypothetical protein B566_EDAN010307 [Ephemera danica]|nr:hypothetical protein B566_EDAN010307 [Ephemera danica]
MAAMSVNEEIVFRIMLAPDVHLGFADEDSTRFPTILTEADDEDYSFNIAVRDVPRPSELTAINIKPLVFQKGSTQLAIYGLGHQNDTKLHNRFRNNKVNFHDLDKERVNVCLLHQNRVARRREDFIPESLLPADLDLIVWGGEDECNFNLQQRVVQTGRAVTTSLTNVNSCLKHIGILEVKNKQFEAQQFLTRVIESMILGSAAQRTGNDAQPTLPLIHIIVEYNEEDQLFNLTRFGQHFVGRVANPFSLVKINSTRNPGQGTNGPVNMRILSVGGVNEAVMALVDRRDTDALEDCVDFQRLAAVTELQQRTARIGLDYQVNRVRDSMAIEHHVLAMLLDSEQRQQIRRQKELESLRGVSISVADIAGFTAQQLADRAIALGQQRAMVHQPAMVRQAHQPLMVHQPALVRQAHQPLMVQQPALVQHPVIIQQAIMGQAASQHQVMAQQPIMDQAIVQQSAFLQNRTQQFANQNYLLASTSNAHVDTSAGYYRASGTPSSDTDSSTTSSSWVDRLDGVTQYRRSTTYQQPDLDTIAQYQRPSPYGADEIATDLQHRGSTNVLLRDHAGQYLHPTGNTVQQPAGNSAQQPDDDIVYLGFSNEPRNQDQGPRRKRPKLETKTGDSSCQPHYNQHG